jgi:sarcosine oxidase/L-pipecolate oxidase
MLCGKEDAVLVVGGGCFGISTAYHLLKRGFKDVTVVDRSDVLPAPDAASTDISESFVSFASKSCNNLCTDKG